MKLVIEDARVILKREVVGAKNWKGALVKFGKDWAGTGKKSVHDWSNTAKKLGAEPITKQSSKRRK